MSWVAAGTTAAGLVAGAIKNRRDKKAMEKLTEKRPEYKVQKEAYENQALAKNMAFGEDRGLMQAEENIRTQSANAIGNVQQVSNSTQAIIDAMANVQGQENLSLANVGVQKANIQSQRMRDLYGANNAVIDEGDKAFGFNENDPYQNEVASTRERQANSSEMMFKAFDTAGAIAGSNNQSDSLNPNAAANRKANRNFRKANRKG